ncbi:MAG: DUF4011 domain-containing protein, partial [Nitrososphaerales archaeon]
MPEADNNNSYEFIRLEKDDVRAKLAAQSVEKLRTKLLDQTARNPLLNYRHSDRARAQIRVIDEVPNFIYSQLAEGNALS